MKLQLLNLALQLGPTLFMTGVIWFVQLVTYPQFQQVGSAEFDSFHASYSKRVSLIVIPPMLLELAASVWAISLFWQTDVKWLVVVASGLTALIWASTFFLQVPYHSQLTSGFNEEAAKGLVSTNWIRTVLWTLRSGLLVAIFILWLQPFLERSD